MAELARQSAIARRLGAYLILLACCGVAFSTAQAQVPVPVPVPAQRCKGPLTGRVITVPLATGGFGGVQAGRSLPLLHVGEFVLSFDDGPSWFSTETLIGILDEHCIHAMFMEVGNNARKRPDLSRAVVAHGNVLGSHSADHKNFSTMTPDQWHADILGGADMVETAATGQGRGGAWRFFRIPGATGVPQIAPPDWMTFLRNNHLLLAGYDASGDDWKNGPPQTSFKILMARLKDRGVIVMHEGQSNTPAFLQLVLAELQRRGAKIVTLALPSR